MREVDVALMGTQLGFKTNTGFLGRVKSGAKGEQREESKKIQILSLAM